MQLSACFRRVCFPLLLLIAVAVLGTSCHAVSMRVTVGFDGVQKVSVWTPIAVRLTNDSEDNVEALLVVDQTDSSQPPLPTCTSPVNLPAHSSKLYHAYVRLNGLSSPIRVTLARGYGVLASKEINISPASNDDRVVLAIGDRASRLSYLQGETINVPTHRVAQPYGGYSSSPPQVTIHAGSLSPKDLPDRPAGYEGADVIIASGLSPDTVDPNALKALCMWVAGGGTLVVSTGADYKAYMNPFYDELLPVKIQGAADLPGITLAGDFGRTGSPMGPAAVTKAALKPGIGTARATESGLPLIAVRNYGAGLVIFLAFDIHASPFRDWNGQTEFWKTITKQSVGEPLVPTSVQFSDALNNNGYGRYQQQPDSGLAAVVMQNPSIRTPSVNTIGFFLLAYLIVLVPVNYAVLQRKRRLELAWITTPAIVLLFALGAYVIGYTMKGGELRLCECRVVEGSAGARFARCVSNAFVFSPARRSYELSVADPTAVSQVIPLSRDDAPVDTYLGEATSIRDVGIPMWSSKTFEAVGGEDLGGAIETNLTLNGSDVTGTIKNNTNIDLHDCVAYYGNAESGSIDLRKGEVKQIRVAVGSANQAMPASPNYYDSNTGIKLRLLQFSHEKAASSGPITLVGFSSSPRGVFTMPNARPRTESAACYVFHLNYSTGNSISITPAMVTVSERLVWLNRPGPPAPSPPAPSNGGFLNRTLYDGQELTCTFRLPVPTGLKTTSLSIVGSVSKQAVCVIRNNATGKWDPLSVPSVKSLSSPGNYVGSDNQVMIRITNTGNSVVNTNFGISAEAKR